MTTAPDEVEMSEVAVRLRLVVGRLSRRIRVDARGSLPPLQLSTLVTLDRHGPQRLYELARRENVAKSTMSRVLTAMHLKGLVTRAATPDDARGLMVGIAPAGTARLLEVFDHSAALIARRLDRLDPDQRAALEAALPALEALLVEDDRGARPRSVRS